MKTSLLVVLVASSALFSSAAIGQNDSLMSSARELGKEGLEAYDAGRYEEAVEKLGKAYQLVPVPTLAINRARALVRLGKWVSAAERYLETIRIPEDKTWQAVQREAQRDAASERRELMPRIPRVKVTIQGAAPSEVEIAVDGVVLPAVLIGIEQLHDPGVHQVRGKRGAQLVTESIAVAEGEHATVTLRFGTESASASQPRSAVPRQRNSADPATQPRQSITSSNESSSNNHQRLIGWVGVSAGGAGVLLGSITGLLALSKQASLNSSVDCDKVTRNCTDEKKSEVDAYNRLLPVTTVGFIAGGVLTATGVTLLLTAPSSQSSPRVGLWLNPRGASLTGRF